MTTAAVAASPTVVTVTPTAVSAPVQPGFVGISFETATVTSDVGTGPAINPIFVRLIRALAPRQRPVLRIGGDSTDSTWWPLPGVATPPGIRYTLNSGWLQAVHTLAQKTRARLIMGINLEERNHQIARTEAGVFLHGIGRRYIGAFEVGNEPDLYDTRGWYRGPGGQRVHGRPPTYQFPQFLREFSKLASHLPALPLAGPAAGKGWTGHLRPFITLAPRLGVVTVHAYQLGCRADPSLPGYATVPRMLEPQVWLRHMRLVARDVAFAHAHGVAFRIAEMNGVSCGGRAGVSDSFALALWALESLFAAASVDIDGVNIHTYEGTVNRLFTFQQPRRRWIGIVHPEYYGMLMFTQAAPAGSRILKLSAPGSGALRPWATLGADGRVRVLLINDSLNRARAAIVRAPQPRGHATVERLMAPSAYALGGVTLGGRTFGAQTTTGSLTGASDVASIRPHGGEYALTLPPASAALLTIG